MKNFRWLAGAAAVLALTGINASADVITNFPVKDSGMYPFAVDGRSNRGIGARTDIGTGSTSGAEGEGTLIKFDLRPGGLSVIPSGHVVTGAQLRFRSASNSSYIFIANVVAYPLAADWQEGVGTGTVAATPPGTGFPWAPASVGDAVHAYKVVTEVDMATNINATYTSFGTNLIAKTGEAWGAAGGRGIGTDVIDRKMIDMVWTKEGYPSGRALTSGLYFPPITFTTEGVNVITEWANGTLVNHGFNVWGTRPATDTAARQARMSSRESAWPPELVLFTVLAPNPRTLLIFR